MNRDGEVTNYTYNSLNQITQAGDITYTWDYAGNLVSQSRNGVIAATYTYDCHNRMISANVNSISGNIVESYTYDYLGNRTSKTTDGETTYFTTDLSTGYSQVLKAENSSEAIYYTRGFELISRRVGQDAHYYLFDGGMSVRGLTDESGVLTDTFVFDAFGNEVARTGSSDNSYGFQGEEKDATGLYYLRARYMDPSSGTFTSMDTYAGSLSDPMSLHKYLFANSNPVKYCDPSGHEATLVECIEVCAIIGIFSGTSLYLLDCFENDRPITGGGLLLSAVIGALIAIVIFFAVYAIAKLIVFMIAYFSARPDDAARLGETVQETVSNVSSKPVNQTYSSNVSELLDKYPWISGDTVREKLLNLAQSNKVASIINELYRPGATIGDGGTADALVIEGTHLQKVIDRIEQIQSIFRSSEVFSLTDMDILEALYYDLIDALSMFNGD